MATENDFFCSDLALEKGVPLIGSAAQGNIWFMLEYPGRWGRQAVEESDLVRAVKNHLTSAAQPGLRLRTLLIKDEYSRYRERITLFIGQPSPLDPRLYEYHLANYAELLELDLAAYAAGQPGDPRHLRTTPLYLVCTNGLRDKCCARFGPQVYQAMRAEAGDQVWQCSHIAGHNKGPVQLFFPHGLNYGRATPDQARQLVQAYQRNEVMLEFYRGRVCFAPHEQAAEHFWRVQTGDLDLPGMRIQTMTKLNPQEWQVTIVGVGDSHTRVIQIQRFESDTEIPVGCTPGKTSPIILYQRVEYPPV